MPASCMYRLFHVIARHQQLGRIAARVHILPADADLLLLAGQQGEVVVRVEHRQELLAVLLAYEVQAHH